MALGPETLARSHAEAVVPKSSGGLWTSLLSLLCMVVLTGPAPGQVTTIAAAKPARGGPAALGRLPATFAGDLPCADCPGLRYQLELFPGRAYFLHMTYLGRGDDASVDAIGRWTVASDRRTLVLSGGREGPVKFDIRDSHTLRMLDREGRAIASSLNYDLKRVTGLAPLEPRLGMRGMYAYLADAGRFTECLTGQTWPVAQEGDNAALESAYVRARHQPGERVLATLEGRVAMRPRVEGGGQQPALVVERFIEIEPKDRCAPRPSAVARTMKIAGQHLDLFDAGGTPGGALRGPRREVGVLAAREAPPCVWRKSPLRYSRGRTVPSPRLGREPAG